MLTSLNELTVNTATQPWRLGGFFHYLSPKADGDPAKVEPLSDAPDYYRQVCAWVDRGHGSMVGCWFPEGGAFKCNYWKDAPAAFHADLRVETDLELAPGAKWEGGPDLAFFYALPEATIEAHAAACRRIAQEAGFEAAEALTEKR